MKIFALAAAAAFAILTAAPAMAQDDAAAAAKIINNPDPSSFQVYGLSPAPKSKKDDTVQGGRYLPVAVTGSGSPYSVGVNVPINQAVKAGDKLTLMFYAKLGKAEPGVTSVKIANAQVQLAAAPYTGLFGQGFDVGPEWKLYTVSGKADKDYAKGILNAAFHVNTGKHTLMLGMVAVMNDGQ